MISWPFVNTFVEQAIGVWCRCYEISLGQWVPLTRTKRERCCFEFALRVVTIRWGIVCKFLPKVFFYIARRFSNFSIGCLGLNIVWNRISTRAWCELIACLCFLVAFCDRFSLRWGTWQRDTIVGTRARHTSRILTERPFRATEPKRWCRIHYCIFWICIIGVRCRYLVRSLCLQTLSFFLAKPCRSWWEDGHHVRSVRIGTGPLKVDALRHLFVAAILIYRYGCAQIVFTLQGVLRATLHKLREFRLILSRPRPLILL